jgi:hypothetical protein
MPKYIKQNKPVECHQWHPQTNPSPHVQQPVGYGVPIVETIQGMVVIHPGDWIIENPDGTKEVMSDPVFKSWYSGPN